MSLTKGQAIRAIRSTMNDDNDQAFEPGNETSTTLAGLIYLLAENGMIQVRIPVDRSRLSARWRGGLQNSPPYAASSDPVFIAGGGQ